MEYNFCNLFTFRYMDQQTDFPVGQSSIQPIATTSSRNRKIGLYLIIVPFAISAVMFIAGSIFARFSNEDTTFVIAMILEMLAGACASIGVVVGIPLGIVFLRRKEL